MVEVLAELGVRAAVEPFRKPPNPWLAALGYCLFGAVAGAISIWIIPASFITSPTARVLNLLATPVFVGLAMMLVGRWRAEREQELVRLDRFSYGYLFALCVGLIRFAFAH